MPRTSFRNFHLPLPIEMLDELRREARRINRPATETAREAISTWLDERRRVATANAIREYAEAVGGSQDDLDPVLEAAAVHSLIEPTRAGRRKTK